MTTAEALKAIYAIVRELESSHKHSHRRFTPDGHLIGSIGEVLVAERYNLSLFDPSYPIHDAKTPDGKLVQIKATQGNRVGLSVSKDIPDAAPEYLIVIKINPDGSWDEVYNGPGREPWLAAGKTQKNGQKSISLSKLYNLNKAVTDRIG